MIKEGHFGDRRFNESFSSQASTCPTQRALLSSLSERPTPIPTPTPTPQDLAWKEEREFVGMDEAHYDRMRMKLEGEVRFEMQVPLLLTPTPTALQSHCIRAVSTPTPTPTHRSGRSGCIVSSPGSLRTAATGTYITPNWTRISGIRQI